MQYISPCSYDINVSTCAFHTSWFVQMNSSINGTIKAKEKANTSVFYADIFFVTSLGAEMVMMII